jgi:NAD(P)H dehydrogenase (quinone)
VFAHVPVCQAEELAAADAIVFGTPTRFGNLCGQMGNFLDTRPGRSGREAPSLARWGASSTSSVTQHCGQESTILSFHTTLVHHGLILVGLPYTFERQSRLDEITGGSPYGASTIAGPWGERQPSENELEAAWFQGEHVARIASKMGA